MSWPLSTVSNSKVSVQLRALSSNRVLLRALYQAASCGPVDCPLGRTFLWASACASRGTPAQDSLPTRSQLAEGNDYASLERHGLDRREGASWRVMCSTAGTTRARNSRRAQLTPSTLPPGRVVSVAIAARSGRNRCQHGHRGGATGRTLRTTPAGSWSTRSSAPAWSSSG